MSKPFADRADAGRVLAEDLKEYSGRPDVIVLGLPRGGIPVAYEVALALHAPLDVFLVRKLGAPGQEELAMGAIASGGVVVVNDEVIDALGISQEELKAEVETETRESPAPRGNVSRRISARPDQRKNRDLDRRRPGNRLDNVRCPGRSQTL